MSKGGQNLTYQIAERPPDPPPMKPPITGFACFACGCQDCRHVDLGEHGVYICCPVCKARRKALKPPGGEI